MTYFHRMQTFPTPTKVRPPRRISAGIPVWVAPGMSVKAADYGKSHLIFNEASGKALVGESSDYAKYGLSEAIAVQFGLYRIAPGVFIPVAHETAVSAEEKTFANDELTLTNTPIKPGSEVVKDSTEVITYVRGTDYTIDNDTGVVSRLGTGSIPADAAMKIDYSWFDPDSVDATDIIGGVDANGVRTGLELATSIPVKHGIMPGTIASPGWSTNISVAIAKAAVAARINTVFKCFSVADLDPASVVKYSDASSYKTDNNLTAMYQALTWPQVKFNDELHWLSTHLACRIAATDLARGGIPSRSPSNQRLEIEGACLGSVDAADEIWLELGEVEYLNSQGIVTAFNMQAIGNGWVTYGGRTAAYPGDTDVRNNEIHNVRMFNWLDNTLIMTYWHMIDGLINRRMVDAVVYSQNQLMESLRAGEHILGGRCEFLEDENQVTNLIDGIVKFHTYMLPAPRARQIDNYTELDPDYISTLFGN